MQHGRHNDDDDDDKEIFITLHSITIDYEMTFNQKTLRIRAHITQRRNYNYMFNLIHSIYD